MSYKKNRTSEKVKEFLIDNKSTDKNFESNFIEKFGPPPYEFLDKNLLPEKFSSHYKTINNIRINEIDNIKYTFPSYKNFPNGEFFDKNGIEYVIAWNGRPDKDYFIKTKFIKDDKFEGPKEGEQFINKGNQLIYFKIPRKVKHNLNPQFKNIKIIHKKTNIKCSLNPKQILKRTNGKTGSILAENFIVLERILN